MAEKMAERIAEILKGPNFQTAEKALTDFCGTMDGEFRNLLVDIIVERWRRVSCIAGGNPKLSHRTDQQGKDIGFFMGCGK